jgi:hypothetical protein
MKFVKLEFNYFHFMLDEFIIRIDYLIELIRPHVPIIFFLPDIINFPEKVREYVQEKESNKKNVKLIKRI